MDKEKNDRRLSRRSFAKAGLGAAALAFGGAIVSRVSHAGHHEAGESAESSSKTPELVTDVPANAGLLAGVKYVAVSELEGKNCGNCQLLLQRDGDYGQCGLFQKGKVPVAAHCTSWIKKAGS